MCDFDYMLYDLELERTDLKNRLYNEVSTPEMLHLIARVPVLKSQTENVKLIRFLIYFSLHKLNSDFYILVGKLFLPNVSSEQVDLLQNKSIKTPFSHCKFLCSKSNKYVMLEKCVMMTKML